MVALLTMMRRTILPALAVLLPPVLPPAAHAVPGGEIGTLPLGYFACELPGDAAGPPRRPMPEEDFTVVGSSSYRANGLRGSYLMTGDTVVMTSGPHAGKRYLRQSHGFVLLIGPDGEAGPIRCVLATRNNS